MVVQSIVKKRNKIILFTLDIQIILELIKCITLHDLMKLNITEENIIP